MISAVLLLSLYGITILATGYAAKRLLTQDNEKPLSNDLNATLTLVPIFMWIICFFFNHLFRLL